MTKIVEYMAMARPVVSYELAEARVSAGEAALYAESNDVASFAACIGALLDDPERRRRMGEVGRSRVERELSWQHSQRELVRAYERALERRASASGLRSGSGGRRRKGRDLPGGQVHVACVRESEGEKSGGSGT